MTEVNWDDFEEVGGASAERFWYDKDHPLQQGDSIVGRLVSKQPKVGETNSIYVLEVEGERVGIWGSTVLDTKLGGVATGKMVAIQYLGEVPSKVRGRKPYKDFKVGQGIVVPYDE